jgi:DNA-binding transcriptional MocR family regulator
LVLGNFYRVSGVSIEGLLGAWTSADGYLNEKLTSAIEQAIYRGDLPEGCRLPSERELAQMFGISRTTVTLAYDKLRSAGLLIGRRGAGSQVATAWADRPDLSISSGRFAARRHPTAHIRYVEPIELTVAALDGSAIVAEVIAEVVRDDLGRLLKHSGYLPLGLLELRRALADQLTRLGLATEINQLLVTTGAQQALDVIAREVADQSTTVLLENPTYVGAIKTFRAANMKLIPIPVDASGFRVDLATPLMLPVAPHLLYVTPNCQNPTGVMLGVDRRQELAVMASQRDFLIIEDLSPDLVFGAGVPPPIASFDKTGHVLSVGSFNKLFWGGLRVGWVRGPSQLIDRLAARKAMHDHATSVLTQAVATRLLGRLDDQRALVRERVRDRLAAATSSLSALLPEWTWTQPAGGLSLWVRLPFGNGAQFAQLAEQFGVIVRPGHIFSPYGGYEDHIRLALGESPERIQEGIKRLAAAWEDFGGLVNGIRGRSTNGVSV